MRSQIIYFAAMAIACISLFIVLVTVLINPNFIGIRLKVLTTLSLAFAPLVMIATGIDNGQE